MVRRALLIISLGIYRVALAQPIDQTSTCPTPASHTSTQYSARVAQSQAQLSVPSEKVRIPVVIHVFHQGDSGRISFDQALSGLEVVNRDFNGLNDDFDEIDPRFDSIKATMNIEFILATIDPDGQPTTGVVYHEDSKAAFNRGFRIYDYAWDNFSYLNIYLPIFSYSVPSIRTAYAELPGLGISQNGRDGIVYSSVRWGVGEKSELEPNSEPLSIATHEVGHWLNLRHPFSSTCSGVGDSVEDTPPTLGDSISFTGCNNFDFSCGVATNGSNYMDYNHGCKKMFTKGQVDRMYEALVHPARVYHWSVENLIKTGIIELPIEKKVRFFKDSNGVLTAISNEEITEINVYDLNGKSLYKASPNTNVLFLRSLKTKGLLLYEAAYGRNQYERGKFISR